jgi:hypothetical protein
LKSIKNKVFILLLCIYTITISLSINAFATNTNPSEKTCAVCGIEHNIMALSPIQRIAYNMNVFISDGNLFYSSSGSTLSTEQLLRLDINGPAFSQFTTYAKNINSAIVPVALVLCVIWGCLTIINLSTEDMLTPEKLFLTFIKMLAGIFILSNWFDIGSEIVNIAINFGSLVFGKIDNGLVSAVPASPLCNYDNVLGDFWAAVFDIISLAVVFIVMNGVKVAITFLAWIRLLEILIRMAFAPVPLSDIMYEGTQSNGFTYIKKLIANVLQAAVIVAGSSAYSSILASITGVEGAVMGRMMMIILAFVMVIIVFKSQSLANDVIGS